MTYDEALSRAREYRAKGMDEWHAVLAAVNWMDEAGEPITQDEQYAIWCALLDNRKDV